MYEMQNYDPPLRIGLINLKSFILCFVMEQTSAIE